MVWLFDRRGRLGTTRQQRNESFCRECMREEFHSLPALAGEFSVRRVIVFGVLRRPEERGVEGGSAPRSSLKRTRKSQSSFRRTSEPLRGKRFGETPERRNGRDFSERVSTVLNWGVWNTRCRWECSDSGHHATVIFVRAGLYVCVCVGYILCHSVRAESAR